MKHPLVSIIIPVYNGSNYLAEAIDCALAQTYDNIEIIVVNDGSKDDLKTEKIALGYGDKIRYISKENGGSSSALNIGIKNMKGEYFSWLSHDDLYTPDKIQKQLEVLLHTDEENIIAVCSGILIDGDGQPMLSKKKNIEGIKNSYEVLTMLTSGNGINGCGVLIPKTLIDKVGFFDETMVYLNDLDYWCRLTFEGVQAIYTKDKLVKTRIHKGQVSVTKKQLFDVERHFLANKLLKTVKGAKIDYLSALKQIAYFCASENLKTEFVTAKRMLSTEGEHKFAMKLFLSKTWFLGLVKRLLKSIRKKLLFHR